MRKVVTSYIEPDMDGISAMYAYTEYLRKKGEEAEYYYEGKPKTEVQIVLDTFNIKLNNIDKIEDDDKIVMVDTNYFTELSKIFKMENVVEIIDHHKRQGWYDGRDDIKVQIEPIGAAATLVAERFKNNNMDISKEAAILLYNGIISNTMNLKIKMTTKRDIDMASWLKSKASEITDDKTKEIFIKKSEIGDRLREEMEVELKDYFMSLSWSMGQLEIANVDDFLEKYEEKIREILKNVKEENDVQYISVNCMDVLNGYSIIVAENEETAKLISDTFGFKFKNLKAKTDGLVSRKELVKVMRDIYKKD